MTSPLVIQFRKGGVSKDVRLTAASGALPLTPSDQVELLYLLTRDKDNEVSGTAEKSLLAIDDEALVGVLKDTSMSEQVLAFFGGRSESDDVQQAIVRNATTPDETIRLMVPRLSEVNLEFVVVNQTRLLRHTPIIAALEANENLSSDQARRVRELKHDFKLDRPAEEPVAPAPAPVPETDKLDLGQGPAEEEGSPPKSREEAEEHYLAVEKEGELSPEEEEERKSIFEQILTASAAQKMLMGLKGGREARMMLIRDRNRTVWSAVLSSPKMNDADAEQIAKMRNVAPDVLREISKNRQWVKRYSVAHELVKNPKTPPEVSTKLLQRIKDRDLKSLIRDRNVPEQVRRMAQKRTKVPK
jgi:hypothetical protein